MKKSTILLALAMGVLTACDPIKDEENLEMATKTASELESLISFSQFDVDGNPAADGNYFKFETNPATIVSIYTLLDDGKENLLAYGNTSGSFIIKPGRGSDPNQKFYVRYVNTDGSETVVEKTCNVFVQQELEPEIRVLASDVYGKKVWKWDNSITGAVWGNMGYLPGDGVSVGTTGNGQWWGVTSTDEFNGQLQHTPNNANEGDGDMDAYMEIGDDGFITCYDATGKEIRKGTYSVLNYNANYDASGWKVGELKTDAILWPWIINTNGTLPSQATWGPKAYEIVYLTADKMTLVYPGHNDKGEVNGSWGEATFWHFKSNSDLQGMAAGYEKTTGKSWTWDSGITGAVWGNMGYLPGDGVSVGTTGNGQWWGVTSTDEFNGQLQHTPGNANEGDGDLDAYMTIGNDGNITSYKGDGTVIRKGSFEITPIAGSDWKVGELKTSAILWPWIINTNGTLPADATWGPNAYEIVYLTADKMTLVYPGHDDKGEVNGSWGEATFWHFKAK